ncbi:MAG: DNA polymerase III subunit delta [Rothia sp. (in: high G+C Gram-positive bacteria)]|nr:DNA polymerase III subunit delta [Rothia sp. (in: high G+C Gram-positive bacteria)]
MAKATRNTQNNQQWRDAQPAPAVLIYGNEDYIVSASRSRLKTQFVQEHHDAEEIALNAKDYRKGELLNAVSPSLFGGSKVILISNAALMNEDFLAEMLDYLQNPEPTSMVILHHAGGNRGKKLIDVFRASRTYSLIEAKPLKTDHDKASFVNFEFALQDRKIEPRAARLLIAACGNDVSELASACSQLIEDTEGPVTESMVDTYYGGRTEVTAFKVSDAAVAGDSRTALKLLRHALSTGVEPIPLVGALGMRMRNIARVHGTRGNANHLAGELKLAPWQVEQAQRDSRRYSADDLKLILKVLADTDAQLKGEAAEPLYALEKAILAIAS